MSADDPLTSKELAFRRLIGGVQQGRRVETNPLFALWCSEVRAVWASEHAEHCARVNRDRGK
jgi:hypothetical protein